MTEEKIITPIPWDPEIELPLTSKRPKAPGAPPPKAPPFVPPPRMPQPNPKVPVTKP